MLLVFIVDPVEVKHSLVSCYPFSGVPLNLQVQLSDSVHDALLLPSRDLAFWRTRSGIPAVMIHVIVYAMVISS